MSNGLELLVVTLLTILGSSITYTKRIVPRFGEDCVNFESNEPKYHLPDNILAWDKLRELKPCCVEDEEVPGCTVCNGNVLWKFNTKDYGPTVCTTVPLISRVITDDLKVLNKARRLIGTSFGPSMRSRDSNYMSSASTESPGGKSWAKNLIHYLGKDAGLHEYENSQGLRSENSPQLNQEFVPQVLRSESSQPHPRMFSSGEEAVDHFSFLKNMFSQLFTSNQPVLHQPINTTDTDIDKNKQSIVPLDCTFPADEINPVASDWYLRERDETPWESDRFPEVPMQGPQHVNAAVREYGGKSLPTGHNYKSKNKRIHDNHDTIKREFD